MKYDKEIATGKIEALFKNECSFNEFAGITKEEIEKLREDLKERRKRFPTKGDLINNIIQNISNTNKRTVASDFDRKIMYLIEALDPHLFTYKQYVLMDRPNNKKRIKMINELAEEKRLFKLEEEKIKLSEYISSVEAELGLFIKKLIPYESKYQNYLKEIQAERAKSLNDILFLINIKPEALDYSLITKETYDKIKSESKEIKLFILTSLQKLIKEINFQCDTLEENILYLIQRIDPDFYLLEIYEQYSNIREMFKKIRETKNISINTETDKKIFILLIKFEKAIIAQLDLDKVSDWQM